MMSGVSRVAVGVAFLMILGSCASSTSDTAAATSTSSTSNPTTTAPVDSAAPPSSTTAVPDGLSGCAHVVGVEVSGSPGSYTFAVTVSSSETGWDKYADAWIVRGTDGTVYGERVLAHPHVDEQPFTRSLSGVIIPEAITEVVVAAQDSVLGFCGDEMIVDLAETG